MSQKRKKKLVIGIDEAGYGPRLGPLIIGGSAWLLPAGVSELQLMDSLANCFLARAWHEGCDHVPLGDSKILYQSGKGLATLESGLIAMSLLTNSFPKNLAEYIQRLVSPIQCKKPDTLSLPPWYHNLQQFSVPGSQRLDEFELRRLSELARGTLKRYQLELVSIRSVIIDESEFNRQVAVLGSKGSLLSLASLELAGELWKCGESTEKVESVEIYCDRQGGRKNYLPLLMHWMPDAWFTETQRSAQRCSYQSTSGLEVRVHFSVAGDRFPPTALASMAAKYLRERVMESFNQFWTQQVSDLKPTAGYPTDAIRFRADIESAAQRLTLDSRLWWRIK